MSISERDVKKIVPSATYKRGVEVLESGKLTVPSFGVPGSDKNEVEASCSGSRPGETYDVFFSIPSASGSGLEKLTWNCTCPARSKPPCKHVVALLLLWTQKLQTRADGNVAKETTSAAPINDESTEPLEDYAPDEQRMATTTANTRADVLPKKEGRNPKLGNEKVGKAGPEVGMKRRVLPSWATEVEEPPKKRGGLKEVRKKEGEEDEVAAEGAKRKRKPRHVPKLGPVRKRRVGTRIESESSEEGEGGEEGAVPWEEEGRDGSGVEESDLDMELEELVKRRIEAKGKEGPSVEKRGETRHIQDKAQSGSRGGKKGLKVEREKSLSENEEVEILHRRAGKKSGAVGRGKRSGKQVVDSGDDGEAEEEADAEVAEYPKVAQKVLRNEADEPETDDPKTVGANVHIAVPTETHRSSLQPPTSPQSAEPEEMEGPQREKAFLPKFDDYVEPDMRDIGVGGKEAGLKKELGVYNDAKGGREGAVDEISYPLATEGATLGGSEGGGTSFDDILDFFITPIHKKGVSGPSVHPMKPSCPDEEVPRKDGGVEKFIRDEGEKHIVDDSESLPQSSSRGAPLGAQGIERQSPAVLSGTVLKPKKKMRVAGMLLGHTT